MSILQQARSLFGASSAEPALAIPALLPTAAVEPAPAGRPWPPKRLSLALQGGGSFGAFTWGVLDRLLEEPDIDIDSLSGASAGAINGALLASGLVDGGRDDARERLTRFWHRMRAEASFLPFATMPSFLTSGPAALMARTFSPSQLNPFDLNPLRRALMDEVDFDALRDPRSPRLLVATTRVRDGALRIFRNDEIDIDVVLASACLPMIHRTIEIDGEAYWDGGYVSNPPILSLVNENDVRDLVVVQLTPSQGIRTPATPSDIHRRLDQIAFNSVLNAELEALELARKLDATPKVKDLRITRLAAEDDIPGLASRSAADLGHTFIETLHHGGRHAADRWLSGASEGRAALA